MNRVLAVVTPRQTGPVDFIDTVRRRHMVRRFDAGRPLDPAVIDGLLDLGLRAPSAGHAQGRHFLVLADADARDRFWSATTAPDTEADTAADTAPDAWLTGLRTAPALVVCWSDRQAYEDRYAEPDKRGTRDQLADGVAATPQPDTLEQRWPVPYWDVDGGMAAMTILLGAVDLGLGACWFGVPTGRVAAVRSTFDVPSRLTPVGVLALGHPAPRASTAASPSLRRGRRPREQTVSYGRYGAPDPS